MIFSVAVRLAGGSFHRSINFFFGHRTLENRNQFSQRAGSNGNALGRTIKFAVQFRDNQTDGFSGTGAVRYDIQGSGTGAAEVAFTVWRVKGVLVAGIGVDGGHQAFDNTEFFLQYRSHRSQAVSRTRSGGDNSFATIQNILVYAVYNGFHIIAARSRNHNFARTGTDMGFRFGFIGKETGTFEDDVHTQLAPRQFFRIRIGKYFDFFAVNNNSVVFQFGRAFKAALSTVVFEEVQQHVCRSQVVNSNDFDTLGFFNLTQCQTTDTAKTINRYFNTHFATPN